MNVSVAPSSVALSQARPITVAVLAMGGQGGGVLVDWIVALAERCGWFAQSTSVPGVAQRTGATIYYIEMVPEGEGTPVLSLMPAPGDVDVVLAGELMEAGRAILRAWGAGMRTTSASCPHQVTTMNLSGGRHEGRRCSLQSQPLAPSRGSPSRAGGSTSGCATSTR